MEDNYCVNNIYLKTYPNKFYLDLFGRFGEIQSQYHTIDEKKDMLDVLVMSEIFRSRSEARKNWKKDIVIPDGFYDWGLIGKYKKHIATFKPSCSFFD